MPALDTTSVVTLDAQSARLANRKALAISRALRVAARRAASPENYGVFTTVRRRASWFRRAVAASFVLIVILPSIIITMYLLVIASDQYVSEARFAVRDSDSMALTDAARGGLGGLTALQRVQDSFILSDYIRSRTLFEEIDHSIDLRHRYSIASADWLSRLDATDPIEDLVRYWRWKLDVQIDINSGIMTLKVRAFTPEDALLIAREIVKHSEKLINELSERSRRDALKQANQELQRAEDNLRAALTEVRDARNVEGVLDAGKEADATTQLITQLRLRLSNLQQEYQGSNQSVSSEAPHMKVLQNRIVTLRTQIHDLDNRIAGSEQSATLSKSQEALDRFQLVRKVAEDQYVLAVSKYEMARLQTEVQQAYLVTFVQPRLAEDALYPKRILYSILGITAALALWGAGLGIAIIARNHMAM